MVRREEEEDSKREGEKKATGERFNGSERERERKREERENSCCMTEIISIAREGEERKDRKKESKKIFSQWKNFPSRERRGGRTRKREKWRERERERERERREQEKEKRRKFERDKEREIWGREGERGEREISISFLIS